MRILPYLVAAPAAFSESAHARARAPDVVPLHLVVRKIMADFKPLNYNLLNFDHFSRNKRPFPCSVLRVIRGRTPPTAISYKSDF